MRPNSTCNICGKPAFELAITQECDTPDCRNFSREFAESSQVQFMEPNLNQRSYMDVTGMRNPCGEIPLGDPQPLAIQPIDVDEFDAILKQGSGCYTPKKNDPYPYRTATGQPYMSGACGVKGPLHHLKPSLDWDKINAAIKCAVDGIAKGVGIPESLLEMKTTKPIKAGQLVNTDDVSPAVARGTEIHQYIESFYERFPDANPAYEYIKGPVMRDAPVPDHFQPEVGDWARRKEGEVLGRVNSIEPFDGVMCGWFHVVADVAGLVMVPLDQLVVIDDPTVEG